MTLSPRALWLLLGTLAGLVVVNVPELGSDPWEFRTRPVEPSGLLAFVVRAAGRHWDLGFVRTPAVVGALGIALAAATVPVLRRRREEIALALAAGVVAALIVPAVLLQVGLRDSTEPWLFVNDSTYQIEIGGDLVRDGDTPYGYDYRRSGLERWYPAVGATPRQVALDHFAYFPGTALAAAAWRVLPTPLDDFRILVALSTLALLPAALLFPGPLMVRLAVGAALAANPLAVRAAWFGTADAPSLLALVVALALLVRSRVVWAAVLLAVAVLLKQFALVAVPFFAVLALRRAPRRAVARAAGAFAAVLVAGFAPFLVADAGALWADTIRYGADTYRIIGYGLSHLLLEAGVVDDPFGSYPFGWLVAGVWLPATAWLLWRQWRTEAMWPGAVAFTVSMFVLLFIGRVFQTSYLVWPLTGIALACLLAAADEDARPRPGREPSGRSP